MTCLFRQQRNSLCALLILLLFVGMALPLVAQENTEEARAEDDEEVALPVIPYFTSQEGGVQFNVPIPNGWQVSESDADADFIRMTTTQIDDQILVESFPAADVVPVPPSVNEETATLSDDLREEFEKSRSAQGAALMGYARLVPEETLTLRAADVATIDGFRWDVFAFDIEGGGNVSAFVQERDDVYYALYYRHPDASGDFFTLAFQAADVESTVPLEQALNILYPDFDATATESVDVPYASSVWTRTTFELPGGEQLYTLHQNRFDKLYVVVAEGDAETLDFVNRGVFTSLFGFFITPQNDFYLWLAVGVVITILVGLSLSIFIRFRNTEKDLRLIEQLKDE